MTALGPDVILSCPACSERMCTPTLRSWNTFGATFWSHGRVSGSFEKLRAPVLACPRCGHCFWRTQPPAAPAGQARLDGDLSAPAMPLPRQLYEAVDRLVDEAVELKRRSADKSAFDLLAAMDGEDSAPKPAVSNAELVAERRDSEIRVRERAWWAHDELDTAGQGVRDDAWEANLRALLPLLAARADAREAEAHGILERLERRQRIVSPGAVVEVRGRAIAKQAPDWLQRADALRQLGEFELAMAGLRQIDEQYRALAELAGDDPTAHPTLERLEKRRHRHAGRARAIEGWCAARLVDAQRFG